jgi:hypothetical protein
MNTIKEGTKKVTIKRVFEGLQAYESSKSMSVIYKELTFVDDELIKEENKSYTRDYEFWKASELGQAIIGMVNLDLMQDDPSAPREEE